MFKEKRKKKTLKRGPSILLTAFLKAQTSAGFVRALFMKREVKSEYFYAFISFYKISNFKYFSKIKKEKGCFSTGQPKTAF